MARGIEEAWTSKDRSELECAMEAVGTIVTTRAAVARIARARCTANRLCQMYVAGRPRCANLERRRSPRAALEISPKGDRACESSILEPEASLSPGEGSGFSPLLMFRGF